MFRLRLDHHYSISTNPNDSNSLRSTSRRIQLRRPPIPLPFPLDSSRPLYQHRINTKTTSRSSATRNTNRSHSKRDHSSPNSLRSFASNAKLLAILSPTYPLSIPILPTSFRLVDTQLNIATSSTMLIPVISYGPKNANYFTTSCVCRTRLSHGTIRNEDTFAKTSSLQSRCQSYRTSLGF